MTRPATSSTIRKSLSLAIIAILVMLTPATAVLGFCAKMPCCFSEASEQPTLAVNMADCCSSVSCYEAPANDLTVSPQAKSVQAVAPATLPAVATLPERPAAAISIVDTSPPPPAQHERLSTLSIFLI